MKVVAGHIGTCVIADDPGFHDIYYDGESHYYIDGTVIDSGYIPVLLVDTEEDKYYQVTDSGINLVFPYEEWMQRNKEKKTIILVGANKDETKYKLQL